MDLLLGQDLLGEVRVLEPQHEQGLVAELLDEPVHVLDVDVVLGQDFRIGPGRRACPGLRWPRRR